MRLGVSISVWFIAKDAKSGMTLRWSHDLEPREANGTGLLEINAAACHKTMANPLQHTAEWHLARRGKITSSRMKVIVHGGPKAWTTLIRKLREELANDEPTEPDLDFVAAISHGRKYEPVALAEAELHLGTDFELVGFVCHPTIDYLGCSSDAMAYERTLNLECKCFLDLAKHMLVYQTGQMPDEHRAQVQCQMCVHGCDRTMFISYHPDAPHWKQRTALVEVPLNTSYRDLMLERCDQFMRAFRGDAPLITRAIEIPQLF